MTTCINISHPSVKELSKQLNLPKIVIAAKIQIFQELNNTDEFPTVDQLNNLKEKIVSNPKVNEVSSKIHLSPSQIQDKLKDSGFFSNHNGLTFIKSQFQPQAENLIGSINKENPGLIEMKRANTFGKNGRSIYHIKVNSQQKLFQLNKEILEQADQTLDTHLLNFLKDFGVQSKEWNSLKQRLGVDALGATDILNKLIWYNKNRNIDTIPEEAGHMIVALMGEDNKDIAHLLKNIDQWEEFEKIKKKYDPIYNNDKQVRIEAIGQLISKAIVKNYKVAGLNKTLLDKLIDVIKEFFKKINSLSFEDWFAQKPMISLYMADKIAIEVLKGNKEFITPYQRPRNELLNYQTAINSNDFAKRIINVFTNVFGTYLTGSLGISRLGENIYRDSKSPIHDLDFILYYTKDQNEKLEAISEYLEEKGAIQIHSGWGNKKKGFTTYSYLVPDNGKIIDIKRDASGWIQNYRYEDKEGKIVKPTPDNVISIDIFVYDSANEEEINKNTVSWQDIYAGKLVLSPIGGDERLFQREKDQEDYVLSKPKNLSVLKKEFLYYQLNNENEFDDLNEIFGDSENFFNPEDFPDELINDLENVQIDNEEAWDDLINSMNEGELKLNQTNKKAKILETQLNTLENLAKELRNLSNIPGAKKDELKKRQSLVENSIKRLKDSLGYDALLFIQQRSVNSAIELLNTNPDPNDVNFSNSIIQHTNTLLDLMKGVQDELSNEQKITLNNLWATNGVLFSKYKDLRTKELNGFATNFGIPYKPLEIPFRDIGFEHREGLSIGESEIPELLGGTTLIEWNKADVNEKTLSWNRIADKFKYSSNLKEELRSFYDTYGRFLVRTKSEYFIQQKEMLIRTSEIIKNTKDKETQAKAFHEREVWYAQNNTYKTDTPIGILKEEKYQKDRKYKIWEISDKEGNYIPQELLDWEIENSPGTYKAYMEKLRDNPNYVEFGIKPKFGYRYLDQVPIDKYLHNDPNDAYNKIKDTELYKFITDTLTTSLKLIPHRMTLDLQDFDKVLNNFTLDLTSRDKFTLDTLLKGLNETWTDWFKSASLNQFNEIGKDTLNILIQAGYKTSNDVLKDKKENIISKTKLSSQEIDKVIEILNKENNTEISRTIKNAKGEDELFVLKPNLDKFTKEADINNLLDTIGDFYKMALSYDHKVKMLPILDMLVDSLNDRKKIKILNSGKIDVDSNGKPLTIEGGLKNARDLLLYTIKAEIFDERITDKGTPQQKFFDPIIEGTRLVGIGYKPFAAASNVVFGKLANYRWAAKRIDFTDENLWWSEKILLGNTFKWLTFGKAKEVIPDGALKTALLMKKLNGQEFSFSKNEANWKGKLVESFYHWMSSGEFHIHGQIMLAMMDFRQIQDLNGKNRPLWDYYVLGENGLEYNHKEFGELKEWESVENPQNELFKFQHRMLEVRKGTQGDYFSALKGKEKVLGRSLAIFKTWLPKYIHERFGREQADIGFKGSYLAYKELYKDNSKNLGVIPGIAKTIAQVIGNVLFLSKSGKTFAEIYKSKGLSDIDIQNMRANVRELRMMAFFLSLALLLKAWDDDDDSPEMNILINMSQRAFYDLSFFYSPNSAMSIIRNPIPLLTTYQNFLGSNGVLSNGVSYLVDPQSDKYSRDTGHLYDSRFLNSALKAIPGLNAIPSSISIASNKFNNESYQHTNN